MIMSVGDKPAYPAKSPEDFPDGITAEVQYPGMSYREWFIGQIAGHVYPDNCGLSTITVIAKESIRIADAIIAQLDSEAK